MKIERFIGGMLESNGYVIYQKDGGNCYVIDPGYHAGVFEECIDRHQLHLSGILLTHHHYDHVGAVEKLRDRYDAPVFMHTADCDPYAGSHERRCVLFFREEQGGIHGRYDIQCRYRTH